ncbi:hypothetical protein FNV43_RR10142 [Rhamnella rubrinervis]|uniref:Uncharacterized protein n=1 Tax=Rhamnella rubrinervis TaxID=2594499 RepID=A0A8K0HCK6_9ROSA|nr:hypothetical protein FNV43_RR10142 [Rhamnella rubrinervis]
MLDMKSILIRTGFVLVQSLYLSGLPRVCLSRSDSLYRVFSSKNSNVCRRRSTSLHFNVNCRGDKCIRRVMSENDIVRSVSGFAGGSRFSGDSFGKGSESGGGGFDSFSGGNSDKGKMGEDYRGNVEDKS